MNFTPITSVTRWLLVVIGCAVLAMAQPMSSSPANDTPAPTPASPPSGQAIIYPKNAPEVGKPLPTAPEQDGSRSLILLVALALAAGGIWLVVQRRKAGPAAGRGLRKLQIEETRSLGNRQYLVVADYDGKKFLLGVTPGRIEMLTPLEAAALKAGEGKS